MILNNLLASAGGFGLALGKIQALDSKCLLGFGVGFGWVWANSILMILNSFLALGVALGFVDSKGLLGFVQILQTL